MFKDIAKTIKECEIGEILSCTAGVFALLALIAVIYILTLGWPV